MHGTPSLPTSRAHSLPIFLNLLLERRKHARGIVASESERVRYCSSDIQLLLLVRNNVNARDLIDRVLHATHSHESFQRDARWTLSNPSGTAPL